MKLRQPSTWFAKAEWALGEASAITKEEARASMVAMEVVNFKAVGKYHQMVKKAFQ